MLMFYFCRFLLDQGVNCTSNVFFVPLNRGVYFARRGVYALIYVKCIPSVLSTPLSGVFSREARYSLVHSELFI